MSVEPGMRRQLSPLTNVSIVLTSFPFLQDVETPCVRQLFQQLCCNAFCVSLRANNVSAHFFYLMTTMCMQNVFSLLLDGVCQKRGVAYFNGNINVKQCMYVLNLHQDLSCKTNGFPRSSTATLWQWSGLLHPRCFSVISHKSHTVDAKFPNNFIFVLFHMSYSFVNYILSEV